MRFCRKNNLSPYFWTHRGCRTTDVTAYGGSTERRQGHRRGLKASAKAPYSTFIYIRVREGVAGGGEAQSANCGRQAGLGGGQRKSRNTCWQVLRLV